MENIKLSQAEIDKARIDLWIQVASKTAGANDCKSKDVPVKYADRALDGFNAMLIREKIV